MDRNCSTSLHVPALATAPPPSAGPSPPMCLIVVSGAMAGAIFRLAPGEVRLGRSSGNTVLLPDSSVSRHHARIEVGADGQAWLSDLGSTNGTYVNGIPLVERAPARIRDGDRVRLGVSLTLKCARLDPLDEQFQREMYERTVRDPLTGLYNRPYFLQQIGPLHERSAERALGLAVMLLDVDHFKRVNDRLGHDAGDAVLRAVAAVLRESTRPEDLVARYGGEEFALALPSVTPSQSAERSEQIRAGLAARPIEVAGEVLRITASIGLAFAPPQPVEPAPALVSRADGLLYRAKGAGRNRVFAHLPPDTVRCLPPELGVA